MKTKCWMDCIVEKKWWIGVWMIAFLGLFLNAGSVYTYEVKTLTNDTTTLKAYRGKVMLIVNTASQCNYAIQLKGLEKLYRTYRPHGFAVLGFPSDQFGDKEPLNGLAMKHFLRQEYGVTFPIFGMVSVAGKNTHPLYGYLQNAAGGLSKSESIKWNFTKFLIDRNGHVIHRYSPDVKPEEIALDIERLL